MNKNNILGLLFAAGLFIGGLLAISNLQQIQDWWFLRNYNPSAEVAQVSKDASFNANGQDLFYVNDPAFNDKQAFNQNCTFEERTIVLGCYTGNRIYILEIDDPKLEGVETVTAAHEMLHAAYDRLSLSERSRIDNLLIREYNATGKQRIKDIVSEYDTSDQVLINNELHSILPTELRNLDPELESYYSQYFVNRSEVVDAAEAYENVFVGINDEIDGIRGQIEKLKSDITLLEANLEDLSVQLDRESTVLTELRNSNQIEEYNARVDSFNLIVKEHNNIISQLRVSIDEHNRLVVVVNEKAVQHNELIQTIDSNYQER